MAMSSKTIATLQRVHKNQPEHLQFFRGHRKCPIVFTHVYIPKSVPTFGRHALIQTTRHCFELPIARQIIESCFNQ